MHVKTTGQLLGAMVTGIGVAVLARMIRQHPRVLPEPFRVLFDCAVILRIALAALLVLGEPALDGMHLVNGVIGAVIGCVVALVVVPDVVVGAFAWAAATGVMAAALLPLGVTAHHSWDQRKTTILEKGTPPCHQAKRQVTLRRPEG